MGTTATLIPDMESEGNGVPHMIKYDIREDIREIEIS